MLTQTRTFNITINLVFTITYNVMCTSRYKYSPNICSTNFVPLFLNREIHREYKLYISK